MQYTDAVTMLFSHNRWANLRLLESCAELTSEQLNATIPGAYGSIHVTWQHIATSERSYFSRIRTGEGYRHRVDAPLMTLAEIREWLQESGTDLIEWAPKVQASDKVTVDWEGTPRDVPLTIILTQIINHATEHREQIKAIMTQLGIEPPDLQGWVFFEATDESGWQKIAP